MADGKEFKIPKDMEATVSDAMRRTVLKQQGAGVKFASRASYYRYSKKLVMKALAPYWQGSRASLKAKVRSYMAPRRRNVGFLSGLLRSALVPGALALLMVTLSTPVAHAADAPVFVEQTGGANPLGSVDVGGYATPTFVDIDGDGDFDAFVGGGEGNDTINFYENTGTADAPVFVEQTGVSNPLGSVANEYSRPTFVDIDGDGDFDVFIGESNGTINFFENTGTADAPVFVEQTGVANPLDGVGVGYYAAPTFVDIDGDGDFDAFVGEDYGTVLYYENTGTADAPVFVEQTGVANPLGSVDVGEYAAPTFVDIDGDGDFDAFVGEGNDTINFFENTGTTDAPVFVEQTGVANPFNGLDVGSFSTPTFVDIDGDGDFDAFVGEDYGNILYYENQVEPPAVPVSSPIGIVLLTLMLGGAGLALGAFKARGQKS